MPLALSVSSRDQSFNRIYDSHESLVRKIIRGFRVSQAVEDDIVQEVFIAAWESLPKLRNKDSASAWLKVIAKNKCLSLVRKKKVEDSRFVLAEDFEHAPMETEERTILGLPLAQFDECMSLLETLICEHANPTRRTIADLFYLQHQSVSAIALRLGMPQSTVLSHLRRFRLVALSAITHWLESR